MRLQIDRSSLQFITHSRAEKLEGASSWSLQATALDGNDGHPVTILLPHDPKVGAGQFVEFDGLTCRASVSLEAAGAHAKSNGEGPHS